jgi:hypothetical protein
MLSKKRSMFSKKKLIPFLIEGGFITSDKAVSYEAYGRKVCAYVRVDNMSARHYCEKALMAAGQKVSKSYRPGHPTVCVDVTYFKAWHWNE